jgi:hypothetical protein
MTVRYNSSGKIIMVGDVQEFYPSEDNTIGTLSKIPSEAVGKSDNWVMKNLRVDKELGGSIVEVSIV